MKAVDSMTEPDRSPNQARVQASDGVDAWGSGYVGERNLAWPRQAFHVLRHIWRHPSNRGRRVRKILEAVVFQARGRLLRQPTLVHVGEHSRLWAHLHWTSASSVVYANPPDAGLLAWRQALKPGDFFVDVGANVGLYTIWAIDCGATVAAIEPDAAALRRLKENLTLNGYQADILSLALADRRGTMKMTTDLGVANHLITDVMHEGVSVWTVPVSTLDEVIGDRVAHGVKIDVEGAELLVLQGARRVLAEHRIRLIQVEWNICSLPTLGQDRSSVAALLQAEGYDLFRPDDRGALIPLEDLSFGPDVFARPRR
jgi:FkbM family methyltransferase